LHAYQVSVTGSNTYYSPWIPLAVGKRYNSTTVYKFTESVASLAGELSLEITNSNAEARDASSEVAAPLEVVDPSGNVSPIAISGTTSDDIHLRDLTGGAYRFKYVNSSGSGTWRLETVTVRV
jgi:hypothetical protein